MLIRDAIQLACVAVVAVGPLSRLLLAQNQPPALPVSATFEVVSIKKSLDPSVQMGARMMGGGRLSAVLTVRALVQLAYGYPETLRDAQLVGGPSWIDTDRFEINATFEGPIAVAPNSPPVRLLSMERALLADRFKLQVHQETRQLPVFDLVRSRADGRLGPGLVPSDGKCLPLPSTAAPIADFTPYCGVKRSVPGALVAKGIPIDRFALLISFLPDVQRIVRDRTGLTNAYDIELAFARDAAAAQDVPPIMTALKEQLGLELKPATGPVDVIVIDHVEQPAPD
jgi:uncharacterized protein (TIGR03435 family)